MTTRDGTSPHSRRWNISLIAESGYSSMSACTRPSAAKASASAMSCRVPTNEPRTVMQFATMSNSGSGKSPGGRPTRAQVPRLRVMPRLVAERIARLSPRDTSFPRNFLAVLLRDIAIAIDRLDRRTGGAADHTGLEALRDLHDHVEQVRVRPSGLETHQYRRAGHASSPKPLVAKVHRLPLRAAGEPGPMWSDDSDIILDVRSARRGPGGLRRNLPLVKRVYVPG